MYKFPLSALLPVIFIVLFSTPIIRAQQALPVFDTPASSAWSDSVFGRMNYEQKIGQLFMVDAYSNRDSIHKNFIASLVCDYFIGGIIFFQGGPVREANLTNYFQSLTAIPLLIGMDAEWGLSMRLDSTIRFPRQMTLGASGNDSMVYKMGYEIGRQCRRMGIHLNFAPVADINNNPLNPVISSRSFGEDKKRVSNLSLMYMNGLQDEHVLACGKHFPGHGNADSDSHLGLPRIMQTSGEMDSVELYPFRELIRGGIASMMVAHLNVPSLDTTINLASTLSGKIVNGLLKEKMGYAGLVFTDALNMKGVTDYFPTGVLEIKALLAGNDVLLYSADVPAAWMAIHYAVQNCEIDQQLIDEKVKKILKAKFWAGLDKKQFVDTVNLYNDLNTPEAISLNKKLYESSITILKNNENILPLKFIEKGKIASLVINDTIGNPFQLMMENYAAIDEFRCDKDVSKKVADSLLDILSKYDYVVFSIHNTSTKAASGYGISDKTAEMLNYLKERVQLITVIFGNAYCLSRIPGVENSKALILSYEDTGWPQFFTAQAIFGSSRLNGHLPVTPNGVFSAGNGLQLNEKYSRLRFSDPAEVNVNAEKLNLIDTLALKAIGEKATPGCEILAAKDGKIFYQKSFGTFTYNDSTGKVKNTDLYDIASVTKIACTALAIMKLDEEGKIDVNKKASKYLHDLKKSNKKDLLISEILTHQAGLKAWIPFWKGTMQNGLPSPVLYRSVPDENFSIRVSDSLYMLKTFKENIWQQILESPIEKKGEYVYSDLGMLIMQRLVEEVTDQPIDEYIEKNFYNPLGLHRLLFNPLKQYDTSVIAPTENDTAFRHKLVRGFVHDPAAAMLGGVAGNAGLFSDAGSLAIIMQMLLNGGEYGGKRYLSKETISKYTATRSFMEGHNRRGLVFDKPEPDQSKPSPAAKDASVAAFGHSGFTGTCAWADPENGLVYIFLSNRVFPDAMNNKLAKNNYRTDIMQLIYEAINK